MLEISLFMNNWLFHPEAWLILGILLVLADLLFGLNYFLLPLGAGSFLTAGLVMIGNSMMSETNLINGGWASSVLIFESWQDLLYWFAGFSVFCTVLMRIFFKKTQEERDINDY